MSSAPSAEVSGETGDGRGSDHDAASASEGAAADRAALMAANPFPGLRSFRPGEADRFFGRQQQIDELVAMLAKTAFIAVSGASGCGKSSLVLAGLLSELKRRHDEDFETDWRPVLMRPGNRPIAHLAAALAAALGGADQTPESSARRADTLYGQLRLGGLALAERVRQSGLPAGTRVLVVVDQFEEIFRFKRMADAEEASAFVKLLLQAAAAVDARVSVVITLRSDTLGACADFRDLPEAASRGSYLVPRLKRDQRKEAIVRPIELRGAHIAPRLVQRLLNDVSDDFDDLPIMQHALSRTWQRWAEACGGSRPIDLKDYLDTGGAASALNDHADETCQSLGALGLEGGRVERVLRALTERVAEGAEVRRPLDFEQLCAVCGGDQARTEICQVVERFRRADTAFLVPGSEQLLADNPTIDISHESLIRQWAKLRGWVASEAEAATELRALTREAEARAQGTGELRHGLDLARGRAWQQRHQPNADWVRMCLGGSASEGANRHLAVAVFLDESAVAEHRAKRRDRWGRRSRQALTVTVVAVSVAAAVVGLTLRSQAQSRELVNGSMLAQAQDPMLSASLAMNALDKDSANPRAEYALRQAMSALDVAHAERIERFSEPLHIARYSDDGKQLLVGGGRKLWLLDANSLQPLATVQTPAAVVKAWQLGEQLIIFTDDGKVLMQGLDGRLNADLSCPGERNSAASAAYSQPQLAKGAQNSDAAQLAVGCDNGALLLMELSNAQVLARHELKLGDKSANPVSVTALGFSGDGQHLASGGATGRVAVWKRGQRQQPWLTPAGVQHSKAVRDISFHRGNSDLLVTASDDGSAKVWFLDLVGRKLSSDTIDLAHGRPVLGASFVARADDESQLMTRADKRVFLWSDAKTFDVRAHNELVTDASSSRDGELLISASADGTAQLWSTRSTTSIALLRGHVNEVTRALFSPVEDVVITASRDHSLRKWRISRPVMLAAGRAWQLSAVIDNAGKRAVICGEPHKQLANAPRAGAQCRITPLVDLARRIDTEDEWLAEADSNSAVKSASFSHDGKWVLGVATSADIDQPSAPVLWDTVTHRKVGPQWLSNWRLARFNGGLAELVTTRPVDASSAESELAVWPHAALEALDPGAPLFSVRVPAARVGQAELSLDGRWLALAVANRVLLWDRRQAQPEPRALAGHLGDVRSLAFSADSLALVSASGDRTARIWPLHADTATLAKGAQAVVLKGHAAALTDARFSADGEHVLTGSTDSSLRLWDRSGRELAVINRHTDSVTAVGFGPRGGSLLSASADGTVRFDSCSACSLKLGRLQAQAQQRVMLNAPSDVGASLPQGLNVPRWLGGSR